MSFLKMMISSTALTSETRFRSRPFHSGAEASVCPRSQRLGIENPLTSGAPRWPSYPLRRGVRLPSVFTAPPQVVTLLTVGVIRPLLAPAGNCGRVSFRLQRQRVVADVLATSAHRPSHRKRRHYRRFIHAAPYLGLALGT